MARTTRTAVNALAQPSALITPWTPDNTNGEQFTYAGGKNKLVVNNASGGSINVTVRATTGSTLVDGTSIADKVVAVAAGAVRVITEASTELQADGNVYVDYSASASVTAYIIQG
jgi:uncharacterized protein YaiL (DUF2058 family)